MSSLGLDHALLGFALAVACSAVRTTNYLCGVDVHLGCRSIRRPTNSYSVHQASDSEEEEDESGASEEDAPVLSFSRAGRDTSL